MKANKDRCSYCGLSLGKRFSFNSFFVTPTIYKCRRWWCTLLKKCKIFKLNFK